MRNIVVVCLSGALIAACAGNETPATLTITPSPSATVSGPTSITASEADVSWTVTGSGTLSGTSGIAVIFRPAEPVTATNNTATVTATATDGRVASVALTVTAASAAIPGGKIPGMSAAATVEIDQQGIPHIFCATINDCFAVQGFLHAQDRLFEMDLFRRTAEGTLSGMIGQVELGSDQQFKRLFTTRDGSTVMAKMASAIDAASAAKLDAYVKGVNAYIAILRATPALMPGEYAQLPGTFTPGDIPDWSATDSFAIGRLQQFQLSESIEEETAYGAVAQVYQSSSPGRVGAYVRAQQPIRDYTIPVTGAAPAVQPAAQPSMSFMPAGPGLGELNAQMREMHEMFGSPRLGAGSNNWVVDQAHSATGHAMVANDPHLQLFYPPLFHLSAMTSADGAIDLAGGSFPGVPGALVGRGKHVGWGVTVVGYDVTDLYVETIVTNGCPSGKTCVFFNGAPVPIQEITYSIPVRGGAAQDFVVQVVPHHGPIVTTKGATPVISMRWTGHEATNDFLGFFGLNTATAVGTTADPATATTAFGALRNYGVGAQNFVLADDQGHIGYDPHALVPKRPWAGKVDTSTGGPIPTFPWLPLPGIGIAEWGPGGGVDCSVATPPASCWVDDANLPQSVDPAKGFLVTANSDPVGTTDDNDPVNNANVPGNGNNYLSFDWDDPTTVRFETITKLLTAKTASGGKVSLADMQAIQSDHSIQAADLFLASSQFATAVPATGSSATALAMLQAWKTRGYGCPTALTGTSPSSAPSTDPATLNDSAACLLFHQFARTLLTNVFADDFAALQHLSGINANGDFGRQLRTMLFMLSLPANSTGTEFCNNVDTNGAVVSGGTLSCAQQVNTALASAFTSIVAELGAPPAATANTTKWLWGKFHTLTTLSPAAPLVSGGFQGGPFARPGGALSVDVGNPDGSQSTPLGFTYSHGSNVRFIGDIQAPTASTTLMQLPGLEKDQPFGVFANTPDLLTPYAANQYFPYLMNHQVDANAVSSQGFAAP